MATVEDPLYDPVTVLSIKSCTALFTCVDEAVLNYFDPLHNLQSQHFTQHQVVYCAPSS